MSDLLGLLFKTCWADSNIGMKYNFSKGLFIRTHDEQW